VDSSDKLNVMTYLVGIKHAVEDHQCFNDLPDRAPSLFSINDTGMGDAALGKPGKIRIHRAEYPIVL